MDNIGVYIVFSALISSVPVWILAIAVVSIADTARKK
jgi:hypothetical protein